MQFILVLSAARIAHPASLSEMNTGFFQTLIHSEGKDSMEHPLKM